MPDAPSSSRSAAWSRCPVCNANLGATPLERHMSTQHALPGQTRTALIPLGERTDDRALAPVITLPSPPPAPPTSDARSLTAPIDPVGEPLGCSLQDVHDEMEALHARLAARDSQVQRELSLARETAARSESRVRELEAELESTRVLGHRSEEALDHLQTSWNEAVQKVASLNKELADARSERDALLTNWDAAEVKLQAQASEMKQNAEDLSNVRGLLGQERSAIQNLRKVLGETREQVSALQKELETRTLQLSRATGDMARAAARLGEDETTHQRLENDVETGRSRISALEHELAEAKAAVRPPPVVTVGPQKPARSTACAPVAFLNPDGRTIAKEALFTLGKGEALETLLESVLRAWKASPYPLSPAAEAPSGLSIALKGDPEKRSIRVLNTGVFMIRLSRAELSQVGDLPPLVNRTGYGLHLEAATPSGPSPMTAEGETAQPPA